VLPSRSVPPARSAREIHAAKPAEPRLTRGKVVDKVVDMVGCSAHLLVTYCSDGRLLIFRGSLQATLPAQTPNR
jgi:hypothetical protein